jgi:ABC-type lipoprotein release transport system permease subunit
MKLLASLRFRIATLFQRSHWNSEMEEELRSHIQHRADDLERSGLARAEAERRARIEFGGYLGAQRKQVLEAALGRAFKLLAIGSAAGLVLGVLASRVLAFIVYQATPRDPLVLGGVVLAMLLLGLLAVWIPAQRALSVNPLILLREE